MWKYDFEIIYQKGSEMLADFLSRQLRLNRINSLEFDDHNLVLDQDQEPWIKEIKDWMLNGAECKTTTAISYMKTYWRNQFFKEYDLLWVRIKIWWEQAQICLVLPSHKIAEILEVCHGTLFTGHEGIDKTKSRIQQNFWWPRPFWTSLRTVRSVKRTEQTFIPNQTYRLHCQSVENLIRGFMQICSDHWSHLEETRNIFCVWLTHAQNMWNWLLYQIRKLKPLLIQSFCIGSVVLEFKWKLSHIEENNFATSKQMNYSNWWKWSTV